MKSLIIVFLLLTSFIYPQLTVDSTAVEKRNASEDWFWGKASYEGIVPTLNDYIIGFLYAENRDNLEYIPAGWFNHNPSAKTITFRTEMGNLPDKKIWVQAYILPKSTVSKYQIGGATYRSQNKDWYYDIYQEPYLETDLPQNISDTVGAVVIFSITATGQNLQYEWYKRTMNPDTTWNSPVKISGEISDSYITPPLQIQWNGWKVFARIYNNLGEIYSRQTLLKIQ